MARVLVDAEAVQAGFATPVAPVPARRDRRLHELVRQLGGWPVMAGLAAATMVGVWIGVNPPAALDDTVLAGLGSGESYLLDVMPGAEFGLEEGAS